MSPTKTPDDSHLERIGYLFGYPISHSLSPVFHQTIFDALGLKWSQLFLESLDMDHFLKLIREPKFFGASVTMPHKVKILEHLDELSAEARDVGACNTIYVRERQGKRVCIGTNTDVVGIKLAFFENVQSPTKTFFGRPGMVIGGGGAARSAVYALRKWMKATEIYIVNRDEAEVAAVIEACNSGGFGQDLLHVKDVKQALSLEGAGAIVACVPNLQPSTDAEWQVREIVQAMLAKEHKGSILEMCYHPTPFTEIARLAKAQKWHVILGTEAMIWQGLEQSKHWRDDKVPLSIIEKVHEVIAAKLDGMRDQK